MRKNFITFSKDRLRDFGQAIINLFIFLPYFFSVSALIKTLFMPWKNLVTVKKGPGFSFEEWINRTTFNFISVTIGVVMRSSIIAFYFLFQAIYMLGLPLVALSYFIFIPLMYLEYRFQKTAEEVKSENKINFVENRTLQDENRSTVERWFETYYSQHVVRLRWWDLKNLFEIPPLARDWASGYTPTIDKYTIDLATPQYLHHIKNIVDRKNEISEIERGLSKNIESNILVVGDEGVGKHTIIDALARKIYLGQTSVQLLYKRILKLDMEKVLGEYQDSRRMESFLEDLLNEAYSAGNIILFIDDFEKYVNFSALFKKFAGGSELQIIGITTPFAYQKYIFNDDKVSRLFETVSVYEVKKSDALDILMESAYSFEKYHNVTIPYETLHNIIEKSEFYLTYIPFPEKAVDLLDATCVYGRSRSQSVITPEMVDAVLAEKTHVPTMVTAQMKEKLVNMEVKLSENIIQQSQAVNQLSSALRRAFLLIGKRKKPLASFLFLGPTGVGKTETAKVIAEIFFSRKHLVRFDMSQFQSKNDIPRLIGDPTFSQPGLLSSSIRENPYGVLLLDEIEKADRDLINIFLTVLDEGYFTDGAGKRVDCKNLLIIATSNAGSDSLYKDSSINLTDFLIENNYFSPEFLNRFDGVVGFEPLNHESVKKIARKMIDNISRDIKALHKVTVNVTEATIDHLVETSYDKRFGARNLERVIRDEIEDKVSKNLLSEKTKSGDVLNF